MPRLLLLLCVLFTVPLNAQLEKRVANNPEYYYARYLKKAESRELPRSKHLEKLFLAYELLQERSYDNIRKVEATQAGDRWLELTPAYAEMLARSKRIQQFLPIDAPTGARSPLELAELEKRYTSCRLRAGDYCQLRGDVHLPAARRNDKLAAREANYWYLRALSFLPEQAEKLGALMQETREWGINRLLVKYTDEAELVHTYAGYLYGSKMRLGEWTEIHWNNETLGDLRLDYEANLSVADVVVGGLFEDISETVHEKEVLDYVEEKQVLVTDGDTSYYVKEEIEHYKIITAVVTEYDLSRDASMDLWLEITPVSASALSGSFPLLARGYWSDSYSTCTGDSNALIGPCLCWPRPSVPGRNAMIQIVAKAVPGLVEKELLRYFEQLD